MGGGERGIWVTNLNIEILMGIGFCEVTVLLAIHNNEYEPLHFVLIRSNQSLVLVLNPLHPFNFFALSFKALHNTNLCLFDLGSYIEHCFLCSRNDASLDEHFVCFT